MQANRDVLLNVGPEGKKPPVTLVSPINILVGGALAYHGYMRTRSIFWAIVYGVAGETVPLVAGVVALVQGFAQPEER